MAEVSLSEAKEHLRVTSTDDDALLTSQIAAAEAYLDKIGVAVAAPIAAPVRQAVLLITEGFYRATLADASLRRAAVDGVGEHEFFGPQILDAGRQAAVNRLVAPYRENEL